MGALVTNNYDIAFDSLFSGFYFLWRPELRLYLPHFYRCKQFVRFNPYRYITFTLTIIITARGRVSQWVLNTQCFLVARNPVFFSIFLLLSRHCRRRVVQSATLFAAAVVRGTCVRGHQIAASQSAVHHVRHRLLDHAVNTCCATRH